MNRLRSGLTIALLSVGICAGGALTAALLSIAVTAEQTRVTLGHVDDTVQDADYTLAKVREQEDAVAHRVLDEGGMLDQLADEQAQLRDVTRSARVSADEVGLASIQQRHYWETELPLLTTDVASTLQETRRTVIAVRPVLAQAKVTLAAAVPVEQQAAQLTQALDMRVNSPQVTAILDKGADLASQSDQAAANLNHSTADAAAEIHGFLHPAWPGKLAHKLKHLF